MKLKFAICAAALSLGCIAAPASAAVSYTFDAPGLASFSFQTDSFIVGDTRFTSGQTTNCTYFGISCSASNSFSALLSPGRFYPDLVGISNAFGSFDTRFDSGSLEVIGTSSGVFATERTLTVSNVESVPGAVPEPATWAMMLLGFGGMGVSLRRRRRSAVAMQTA